MAISLKKGQKVDLTKGNAGLKTVQVGLGWDKQKQKFKLFGGGNAQIDCDASVFLLDENGKLTSTENVVYFAHLQDSAGSILHRGDNRTGDGAGDDETIFIILNKVPANIHKILFVVNIYDCEARKQHFGMIQNAYIRLLDGDANQELMRYNLSDNYEGFTSLITGEVYRDGSEWKFSAIGEGTHEKSLTQISGRLSN